MWELMILLGILGFAAGLFSGACIMFGGSKTAIRDKHGVLNPPWEDPN